MAQLEYLEVITITKAEFINIIESILAERLKDIKILADALKAKSLSTSEAAKYLGVTSATVRNWTISGKLVKNELNGYNLQDLAELKKKREKRVVNSY